MLQYPSKEVILDVLLEAARSSVAENPPLHPEDFAVAMGAAIDSAALTLMYIAQRGYLK